MALAVLPQSCLLKNSGQEKSPPGEGGPSLTTVRRSENILDNFRLPELQDTVTNILAESLTALAGGHIDLAQLNYDMLMDEP